MWDTWSEPCIRMVNPVLYIGNSVVKWSEAEADRILKLPDVKIVEIELTGLTQRLDVGITKRKLLTWTCSTNDVMKSKSIEETILWKTK